MTYENNIDVFLFTWWYVFPKLWGTQLWHWHFHGGKKRVAQSEPVCAVEIEVPATPPVAPTPPRGQGISARGALKHSHICGNRSDEKNQQTET
jgi:hypothetical protein